MDMLPGSLRGRWGHEAACPTRDTCLNLADRRRARVTSSRVYLGRPSPGITGPSPEQSRSAAGGPALLGPASFPAACS